jgi:MSHA biogenesis protein MshN
LGISLQTEKRYAEAEQAYGRARAANTLAPDLQAFVEQRLKQVQQAH